MDVPSFYPKVQNLYPGFVYFNLKSSTSDLNIWFESKQTIYPALVCKVDLRSVSFPQKRDINNLLVFFLHWCTWIRAKFPITIFHMSLAVSIWPILAWKTK